MIFTLALDILAGADQGTRKGKYPQKLQGVTGAPAGQEHERETQRGLFTEVGTEAPKTTQTVERKIYLESRGHYTKGTSSGHTPCIVKCYKLLYTQRHRHLGW